MRINLLCRPIAHSRHVKLSLLYTNSGVLSGKCKCVDQITWMIGLEYSMAKGFASITWCIGRRNYRFSQLLLIPPNGEISLSSTRKITPRHCTLTLTPSPSSTVSYSITAASSLLYTTMLRTSITRALRPIRQTPALTRFYHEKVIDHYERPRNVGSLPKNDIDVGTGLYFPCPLCLFDP